MATHTLMKPCDWYYWIGLPLCLAVVPVLRSRIFRSNLIGLGSGVAIWFLLAAQSIFGAVLLCLIGLPSPLPWLTIAGFALGSFPVLQALTC
jgi:hypothetical protein